MIQSPDKISSLLKEARLLPPTPGVYKMIDKNEKIIYVGKSKNLKNRVSQYFQNTLAHNAKTKKMVEQVNRFECVFTDTENESLVLENELIKLHTPKFNIRLKDDKSYPYIVVTCSQNYPKLSFVRSSFNKKNKGDKYFGPYSSSSTVHDIIDTVNSIFKLPTCKLNFPKDINKKRPCLNYHIDKCMGVCTGNITASEYSSIIKSVILFLKSDYEAVLEELEAKMLKASDDLSFEKAASYRDLMNSIKSLRSKQKIIFNDKTQRDVFGFFCDDMSSCISVTIVREGRITDNKRFLFKNDELLDSETFPSFLIEYYSNHDIIPKEILIPKELSSDTIGAVANYISNLSGKSTKILSPEKGQMREAVVMASENAKEYCLHQRNVMQKNSDKLIELATLLQLEVVPETIEAYDVSNSSAEHTIAGMISIRDGVFSKKNYKLFNIRESQLDDYGATKEALSRRLNKYLENKESDTWRLPDLILMDGGIGHVNCALEVLHNFGLDIPVFGMVKDEHHKTRTLVDAANEVSISHNTKIFNFIFSIQEEVHRFTFSAMDKKRRKSVTRLSLENVKGIGPKKAQNLMKHFKSVKSIKAATADELIKVKGISEKDANEIIEYYKKT